MSEDLSKGADPTTAINAEAQKLIEDVLGDQAILPGEADSKIAEIKLVDQKKGIEWIKQRAGQLVEKWQERFPKQFEDKDELMNAISKDFADLENDFNYIKDINSYVAIRYAEIWELLPTMTELDLLLEGMNAIDDQEFYNIASKEDRIKKIEKLRRIIKASRGG
jgi:hypothetical protein